MRPLTTAIFWTLTAAFVIVSAHTPPAAAQDNGDSKRSRALSAEELASLLSSFRDEPSVREVQRAALEHAGLEAEASKGWSRRARLANLVPHLEGELAWLDQQDAQRRYEEEVGATDDGALRREALDNQYEDDDRFRRVYSIEAELELGGLVFDSDEVSAARELRKQQEARRELIAVVTDLYFERRKKQVIRLVTDPDWRSRLDLVLEIERLSARLDGLTGGWFRRQIDSDRSTPRGGSR